MPGDSRYDADEPGKGYLYHRIRAARPGLGLSMLSDIRVLRTRLTKDTRLRRFACSATQGEIYHASSALRAQLHKGKDTAPPALCVLIATQGV